MLYIMYHQKSTKQQSHKRLNCSDSKNTPTTKAAAGPQP